MTATLFHFPRRPRPFGISPGAVPHLLKAESDWDLVTAYTFRKGRFRTLLTTEEQAEVRMLADGFGRLDPDVPGFEDMLWDWSHVRDSSEEAVARMAAWIRAWAHHYRKVV